MCVHMCAQCARSHPVIILNFVAMCVCMFPAQMDSGTRTRHDTVPASTAASGQHVTASLASHVRLLAQPDIQTSLSVTVR